MQQQQHHITVERMVDGIVKLRVAVNGNLNAVSPRGRSLTARLALRLMEFDSPFTDIPRGLVAPAAASALASSAAARLGLGGGTSSAPVLPRPLDALGGPGNDTPAKAAYVGLLNAFDLANSPRHIFMQMHLW